MEVYLVKYHDKYEKCYVLSVILSIETHGDILSPLKSVDTLLTAFSAAVLFLKERWNAASIESLCWYSVVMWYLLLLWCLPMCCSFDAASSMLNYRSLLYFASTLGCLSFSCLVFFKNLVPVLTQQARYLWNQICVGAWKKTEPFWMFALLCYVAHID